MEKHIVCMPIDIARDRGISTYATPKRCVNGHFDYRAVKSKACRQCKRDVTAKYLAEKRRDPKERERQAAIRRKKYKSDPEYRNRILAQQADYYRKNPEKYKAKSAKRQKEKHQEVRAQSKKYYAKNRESIMAYQLKYAEENREKSNGWKAKNKAKRLKAMPPWFGEIDQFVVDEAYSLAKFRAETHGFEWHVDHRVPLCGDLASGLHCAANIQVIPATINLRKNNRLSLVDDLSWLYTKPPIP